MDKILELLEAEDSEIESFSSEDEYQPVDPSVQVQADVMSDVDSEPNDEIPEPTLTPPIPRNLGNIWKRKRFHEKRRKLSQSLTLLQSTIRMYRYVY